MKINRWTRWIQTFHYPSYFIFFVTARCNARCPMCFYMENMESNAAKRELRVEEYEKISRSIPLINILGISGGEPFLREDLHEIVQVMYKNCSPWVVDLPTNGFLTKSVLKQVEEIARRCPDMVVDLQLSIDGPPEIHNQIRGLKDGFGRMRETYLGLVALKKRYRNLKVKACVVYSHYNQDHIEPLFDMLHSDFTDLDRIVFSVAHGSVYNDEAMAFDWERYFKNCARIREASTVKDIKDLHSIFTIALRIVKNDLLKEILRKKNMVQLCGAGQKVVVINEQEVKTPSSRLKTNKLLLDEAGIYEFNGKKMAVNLANEKESDVGRENIELKSEINNFSAEKVKDIDNLDLEVPFLIIAFIAFRASFLYWPTE